VSLVPHSTRLAFLRPRGFGLFFRLLNAIQSLAA